MVFVEPHWSLGNLTAESDIASSSWSATSSVGSGSGGGILDQLTLYIEHALQKLGLAIANGIATVQQLFAQKVTTNELCVGTTCVNQQQFSALFAQTNNSGGGSSGSSGGGSSTSTTPTNVTTGPALGITIVAPADDSTISGTTELDANITIVASTSVSSVDYQVDGNNIGTGNSANYSYEWDTTDVVDGTHILTAVVTDSTGATSTASSSLTVANDVGAGDAGNTSSTTTSSTDDTTSSSTATSTDGT